MLNADPVGAVLPAETAHVRVRGATRRGALPVVPAVLPAPAPRLGICGAPAGRAQGAAAVFFTSRIWHRDHHSTRCSNAR